MIATTKIDNLRLFSELVGRFVEMGLLGSAKTNGRAVRHYRYYFGAVWNGSLLIVRDRKNKGPKVEVRYD